MDERVIRLPTPPVASSAATGQPEFLRIEEAAVRLSMTAMALRARCRRNARRDGRQIVAQLGAGIVAYKFGRSWRVKFTVNAAA